jgi:vacuolar-type H+-ATPase subunit D/Vma8
MSKTTALIDEIRDDLQRLQVLSNEMKVKYRELAATLLSARALVPENRWEAWVSANLELEVSVVESVMECDISALGINSLMLPLTFDELQQAPESTKTNGSRIHNRKAKKKV